MMVNLMRANQRWLMLAIIFVVSASLIVFYGNRTASDRTVSDRVGSLYDQSVSTTEFSRVQRRLEVARYLGTYDLLRAVTGDGEDQEGGAGGVINYLVLAHEAERLGIQPSDDEIRAAGEQLAVFQGPNGGYDLMRRAEFENSQLSWRGLGMNQVDELVRMNLVAAKLRAVVASTAVVNPREVRTNYEEAFAQTRASVLRLKAADYAAVPEPGEDEIKKYFNDQKDQFNQPERRRVQYVKFGLDEAQQKLPRPEKLAALKPLADQAALLLETLLDGKGKTNFAAAAAAAKLAVQETPDFEEDQPAGYPEAAIPGFAQAAFQLSPANPDSDAPLEVPADTPDAFYDLHLVKVTPERPLSLEEARPRIVAAIKAERANAALTAKAEEIRTRISDAMKAGRSFADAAKDAGQTVQDIPPFSLVTLNRAAPDLREVAGTASVLATGELSKFTPDKDGGFFVYVSARAPAGDAEFEKAKSNVTAQMQRQKGEAYFSGWLRASREQAKPQFNLRSQT